MLTYAGTRMLTYADVTQVGARAHCPRHQGEGAVRAEGARRASGGGGAGFLGSLSEGSFKALSSIRQHSST